MLINPNILIEPTAAIENEPLFKQIVRQIEVNTFKLSFTKISNFMDSPRSFMQYCMKEQTRTKAMKYGSMIHHWLLEKGTFDDNYKVAPEVNLTTTIGKDTLIQYLSDLLTGEEFREFEGSFFEQQEEDNAKRLAKFKPTKTKLECEFINVWGYKDLQAFVEKVQNIEIVSGQDMTKAKKQADAIYYDADFRDYVYPRIKFTEEVVESRFDGWNWKGKIDMGGLGFKGDLKTCTDADPQVIKRQIFRELRHVQGLIYNKISGSNDEYFNVNVDGNFQTSVVKMSQMTMDDAERVYDKFLASFDKCIMEGAWWESYSFWNKYGVFEV